MQKKIFFQPRSHTTEDSSISKFYLVAYRIRALLETLHTIVDEEWEDIKKDITEPEASPQVVVEGIHRYCESAHKHILEMADMYEFFSKKSLSITERMEQKK